MCVLGDGRGEGGSEQSHREAEGRSPAEVTEQPSTWTVVGITQICCGAKLAWNET